MKKERPKFSMGTYMSFIQLCCWLSYWLAYIYLERNNCIWGCKQKTSKWIELLYISISKVRVGKITKWGLDERIKRIRGPRAKCCCWSDKFAEEADLNWILADIKPLLSAEDISKTKEMIHIENCTQHKLWQEPFCLYGNNSHQIQTVSMIYLFSLSKLT